MTTLLFLATIMGWYLVIMSSYVLLRRKYLLVSIGEILTQPSILLLIGVVNLIIGLVLITAYNNWTLGWPIVVTLLSWLVLIGGILRLFYPEAVHLVANKFMARPELLSAVAFIMLIVGLFLLYQVYFSGIVVTNLR